MAKTSFSKAIMIIFVAVVLSVASTVSAQDSAMAPAPSMDTGAAFSLPVSGVAVTFSLIISLVALLKHPIGIKQGESPMVRVGSMPCEGSTRIQGYGQCKHWPLLSIHVHAPKPIFM
ncbi:hypothetical protein V6N12_053323 [Hibiscus sabdariffa]|uniref:Transmembrane protein n=1 Tax=Hibiscus sabdariffa TaxID=183260 RepID=A0ABR2D802_9ROSI